MAEVMRGRVGIEWTLLAGDSRGAAAMDATGAHRVATEVEELHGTGVS